MESPLTDTQAYVGAAPSHLSCAGAFEERHGPEGGEGRYDQSLTARELPGLLLSLTSVAKPVLSAEQAASEVM